MYYYDDFYDEPSEFEKMIDEFKESLAKSVKEEYMAKMVRLEKENAELQDVKNNFEAIKYEHKQKMQELNHKIAKSKDEVRRERLSILMQDFEVVMYKVVTSRIEKPKCDKCNANRKKDFGISLLMENRELKKQHKAKNNWISTTGILPKEDERVIICSKNKCVSIAYYKNYFGQMRFMYFHNVTESWHIFSQVIAWQPLPKPYNRRNEIGD